MCEILLDDTYAQLVFSLARRIQGENESVSKEIPYTNTKVNRDLLTQYCSPRSMDVLNF